MPRLPQPGGDAGNWGAILNDYLLQSHKPDGTLKDNSVTTSSLAPGSVSTSAIADDSVSEAHLTNAVRAKLDTLTNSGVNSVNGQTGAVVLDSDDIDDSTSTHKFVTSAHLTKIDGIATGATANDTDANLKNRANHTGTQPIDSITGLQSALDVKATTVIVTTGNETRPASAAVVMWVGGESQPVNMADHDIWFPVAGV